MTDKLTFSFQGPVKFRLGDTEIDLGKQSTEFHTARTGGKSEPLKGFQAADGTFFRLKRHASGDGVDVIVYGKPENLAKYEFKVKNGDLRKARFSDGAFGKVAGAATAGNFKLNGSSLDSATRTKSLQNLGLTQLPLAGPKQSVPNQVEEQPVQVDSSRHVRGSSVSGDDPGRNAPAADRKPANGADVQSEAAFDVEVRQKEAFKLERLQGGLRSEIEVAGILAATLENGSGGDSNKRVESYLDELITELTDAKGDPSNPAQSRQSMQEANGSIKGNEGIGGEGNAEQNDNSLRAAISQLQRPEVLGALNKTYFNSAIATDPDIFFIELCNKLGGAEAACKKIDQVAYGAALGVGREQIAQDNAQNRGQSAVIEAGLSAVQVNGDGHCWFTSTAVALAADQPAVDAVLANQFDAAMSLRTQILDGLVRISDEQLRNLGGNEASKSIIKNVALQAARGINVQPVDSLAWGDLNTARVAAIVFQRPVVMVDLSGEVSVNYPNGRYEPATEPLATVVANLSRQDGAVPAVIYQHSADHFNGARLKEPAAQ